MTALNSQIQQLFLQTDSCGHKLLHAMAMLAEPSPAQSITINHMLIYAAYQLSCDVLAWSAASPECCLA
jgi:hypothetical protein